MKKLLNKTAIICTFFILKVSFSQNDFETFVNSNYKLLESKFNSDVYSKNNNFNININENGYYISANKKLLKYTNNNKKLVAANKKYFSFYSNEMIFPLHYYKANKEIYLLNLHILNGENDRYEYFYSVSVFDFKGKLFDYVLIGKYLCGEDVDIMSEFIINENFSNINLNYISNIFYEEIDKKITNKFDIEFKFDRDKKTYGINKKGLYIDNYNSIFDVSEITLSYFNEDNLKLNQSVLNFNTDSLIVGTLASNKNKKTFYLIYSRKEKHGFEEHLGHNFINIDSQIKSASIYQNQIILNLSDNTTLKVFISNYDKTYKMLMFNKIQIIDLNGKMKLEKLFNEENQFISKLGKVLKTIK